ncbi:hypothetical protein P7C70_g9228, partial [Phenoliferia sp. Uapishka_3]
MASIHDLPTECLLHILSFVHSPLSFEPPNLPRHQGDEKPFHAYDESLRDLQSASRVSKLWLGTAQSIFWRHINVWTYAGASHLLARPALGSFRTNELNVLLGLIEEPRTGDWIRTLGCLAKELKGLRKIVLRGKESHGVIASSQWVGEKNLAELKMLIVNICFIPFPTPPASFHLNHLELGPLVSTDAESSRSFINSVFTSSSDSLTYLKLELEPSESIFPGLLEALPLVQNSVKSLDLIGKFSGIERLLPKFTALVDLSISHRFDPNDRYTPPQSRLTHLHNFVSFLSTLLTALPYCTTSVK